MDAIRLKDNKPVVLKKVPKPGRIVDDEEEEVALHLSSPLLSKDPRNHSVPIYDVLSIPGDDDYDILVMPLLRPFHNPRFDTIGECVDFFQQIFQARPFPLRSPSILQYVFGHPGHSISSPPSYSSSVRRHHICF